MSSAKSTLEKCHIDFCENTLVAYLNQKITAQYFIHLYYYTLKPLSENYNFPIPEHIKAVVEKLRDTY